MLCLLRLHRPRTTRADVVRCVASCRPLYCLSLSACLPACLPAYLRTYPEQQHRKRPLTSHTRPAQPKVERRRRRRRAVDASKASASPEPPGSELRSDELREEMFELFFDLFDYFRFGSVKPYSRSCKKRSAQPLCNHRYVSLSQFYVTTTLPYAALLFTQADA